jgi:ABC-2 type transport system permease protein
MRFADVFSVGMAAAGRHFIRTVKTPHLFMPVVLFPLMIFAAFSGGGSSVSKTPGFDYYNYTAFIFVYVLLLGSAMAGAQTGLSVAQDFESGFARRMLLSTRRRAALLVAYVASGLWQQLGIAALTLGVALATGMPIRGNALDLLGVFALAAMFNLASTLWASGLALRLKTTQAGAAMMLPLVLPMFFAPSLVPRPLLTSWLHAIAGVNPITPLLEAGRGLLAGDPVSVAVAFAIAAGMIALTAVWAATGLRSAQRSV